MKESLDRRAALKQLSYLVGGAVATPTLLGILQSCEQAPPPLEWQSSFLSEDQARLVSKLADMIIPETKTPGAIEAGVPYFIDSMLDQCLETEAQQMFLDGLNRLNSLSQSHHSQDFLKIEDDQQTAILKKIAAEDHTPDEYSGFGRNPEAKTFFKQLKQLTLLGYFTSEMGATEALEYLQIPGGYDGCTTLIPGQKAWALY
ncbi:MAG: gluconate 2-dehydrogenase subunit 3 family protein [Cyclobacteriaceae bacterium]|nr:gluconate 2-dehydrogenase subunit 3 family protein [Cyclobacteriaceae bacterium]